VRPVPCNERKSRIRRSEQNRKRTDKIRKVCEIREQYGFKFEISVDGGVNSETISKVVSAGADVAVMGSYFFGTDINARKALVEKIRSGK